MDALTIVVYLSGYLFLVFLSISIACGLYFIAELCEEYTSLTKKVLKYTNYFVAGVCVFLILFDHLPFFYMLFSLGACGIYHVLLKNFPFMDYTSPLFLGGAALFLLNNILWIQYFISEHYTMIFACGHLLMCVWLMPFAFFVSSSVNENVLPGAGVMPVRTEGAASTGAPQMGGGSAPSGKASKNVVIVLSKWFKEQREKYLPKPPRDSTMYAEKTL